MELNKPALQAATGAFMDRLTDKPTTGDLLAALRFALEAYESVRLAAAPASQQDAGEIIAFGASLLGFASETDALDSEEALAWVRERWQASRAQRTDKPS